MPKKQVKLGYFYVSLLVGFQRKAEIESIQLHISLGFNVCGRGFRWGEAAYLFHMATIFQGVLGTFCAFGGEHWGKGI